MPVGVQGQSHNLQLRHIPLHGLSIMLLNGLATGVHSSADNIIVAATQYSVDIEARRKKKHNFPHPFKKACTFSECLGIKSSRIFGEGWKCMLDCLFLVLEGTVGVFVIEIVFG